MRKKTLLALLLAATLLLSSCSLIKKDEAVDNATVILQMGDQVITKGEVKEKAEQLLADYGYSVKDADADLIVSAREQVAEDLKQEMVLNAKAKEYGVDQLTEEEIEQIKTEAKENYDSYVEFAKMLYLSDSELEGEALEQAAVEALAVNMGYNLDLDALIESGKEAALEKKLRDATVKDVAVTEEEIQAEYDSHVESDKATYAEAPGSCAEALNSNQVVYYTPAGIRRVKQILIKFKAEDQTAIDEAKQKLTEADTAVSTAQAKLDSAENILAQEGIDEETKARGEEERDAASKELEEANAARETASKAVEEATAKAYENLDADADDVLAKLAEGGDWQALMDEKNEDPGMKDNEKGYAVATGMTNFDSAFVEAAMALEKVGDVSPKTRGVYGYYIIRYDSDEPEGPIDPETVKESISSTLLTAKQDDAYTALVAQWVEEAGIKIDKNALKD